MTGLEPVAREGLSFAGLPLPTRAKLGARGEIRTPNLLILSQPPLPFWPLAHFGARRRIRTVNQRFLGPPALPLGVRGHEKAPPIRERLIRS